MGSIRPYFRRVAIAATDERAVAEGVSLRKTIDRLVASGKLSPPVAPISLRALLLVFPPPVRQSVMSSVLQMHRVGGAPPAHILLRAAFPSHGGLPTVDEAEALRPTRTAAAIHAGLGLLRSGALRRTLAGSDAVWAGTPYDEVLRDQLLEHKDAVDRTVARSRCLAAMAFADVFPGSDGQWLRGAVAGALVDADSGFCGSFGNDWNGFLDSEGGDYDMNQMHLLCLAYSYFDELTPAAQTRLVDQLLAQGGIERPYLDYTVTSGRVPNDWARAGRWDPLGGGRVGETENHILMIHTARYLTNQLLYQRHHDPSHDNRRNGGADHPSCTDLMLTLLRNILLDDFSEYNAKPYQTATRTALLDLQAFAYDHEVRLAARMVLDYVSAHVAVSSSDLRRMPAFRRRNEEDYGRTERKYGSDSGFFDVGLLDWGRGADPLTEAYAMQSGNLRSFAQPWEGRPFAYSIASDGGDSTLEMLSGYRVPRPIHDLFVTDDSRRFFQRLRRTPQGDPEMTGRNVDNQEIYACSPSYLISAGGASAGYAIDPGPAGMIAPGKVAQQLGVAMTTCFMPAGASAGVGTQNTAGELIQFGSGGVGDDSTENYGVAPDFACGYRVDLPGWYLASIRLTDGPFEFVDRRDPTGGLGFFLALFLDGEYAVLEAFDTHLHPDVTFADFCVRVIRNNQELLQVGIRDAADTVYRTHNGTRVTFRIRKPPLLGGGGGAVVVGLDYRNADPRDVIIGDLRFLDGAVLQSVGDGIIHLRNPTLNQTIVLDMASMWHPRRTSETGEIEEAGNNHEVWVDGDWAGPQEGDFFRPFSTVAGAMGAVVDGGVIRVAPGTTIERGVLSGKRVRIVAPIGGVRIGGV